MHSSEVVYFKSRGLDPNISDWSLCLKWSVGNQAERCIIRSDTAAELQRLSFWHELQKSRGTNTKTTLTLILSLLTPAFSPGYSTPQVPSNRHHRSSGDCLEGKGENYQVCSVQYCVQQLCTVQCTHIWTDLTGLSIGFCLTGPISLCLDSFLCMYVNVCIFCMTVYCMNA